MRFEWRGCNKASYGVAAMHLAECGSATTHDAYFILTCTSQSGATKREAEQTGSLLSSQIVRSKISSLVEPVAAAETAAELNEGMLLGRGGGGP